MNKIYIVNVEWDNEPFRIFDNKAAAQALVDDVNKGGELEDAYLYEYTVHSEYDASKEFRFWADEDDEA